MNTEDSRKLNELTRKVESLERDLGRIKNISQLPSDSSLDNVIIVVNKVIDRFKRR